MALPRYLLASLFALVLFSGLASANNYGPQDGSKPPSTEQHQEQPEEEDDFGSFKVQGVIYCKIDGKLIPLQGATARMKCVAEDDEDNDAGDFIVESEESDSNGYYRINVSKHKTEGITLSRCKVYLEKRPPGICRIPTNANHGLTGASLWQYRTLSDKSRLYSVSPFVYEAPSHY